MAITVTPYADPSTAGKKFSIGDRMLVLGTVTFDAAYATGGYALTPAQFGLDTQLDYFEPQGNAAGSRIVVYDAPNKKVKIFTAVGTEAANASDQSTITVPFLAIGK